MAVVQSINGLVDLAPPWTVAPSYGSLRMYDQLNYDYATLYRTQPNVRTCVDFLARNIAQLGLHVFRRVSETDRQRLRDHPLAVTIGKPNPWTTRYRLINSLISDLGIYDEGYWLKVKGEGRVFLLRVPPPLVTPGGGLVPTRYEINLGATTLKPTPDQIVHFRGYNPESPIRGLSSLETLRRVLAEEFAAGDYREYFWRNAARMSGIIERPADAPEWDKDIREAFRQQFETLYSGGPTSGKTAILEDGMTWKQNTFNAQESEYLAGRKLTREECARAYHIPLPMVGILDHATFSNIKDQHKQLYQDCMGPRLAELEEEIILQVLPDFEDTEGVYCEFNIAEKMQGSFEEQTTALQSAVGRPWMTPDEARARFNMPSIGGDAERLATPLNVLIGGQASPRDSAPKAMMKAIAALALAAAENDEPIALPSHQPEPPSYKALMKAASIDPTLAAARARHVQKWAEVMSKFFRRQEAALVGRIRDGAGMETVWIDGERWDTELSEDMFRLNKATATVWAKWVMEQLDAELDEARMENYLKVVSENAAGRINAVTRDQIAAALLAEVPKDAFKELFESAAETRSGSIAQGGVTGAANFGSHEGASQGGLRTKTWKHNGGATNPRDEHVAMDGETVGIGELFSNGMRWPGDPAGGAEQNAHCNCSVVFGRGD